MADCGLRFAAFDSQGSETQPALSVVQCPLYSGDHAVTMRSTASDCRRGMVFTAQNAKQADVAELADALDSGSSARKGVEVQILSSALGTPVKTGVFLFKNPSWDQVSCAGQNARTTANKSICDALVGCSFAAGNTVSGAVNATKWFIPQNRCCD